jgi:ParB family chromosome partitioning protein
LVPIGQIKVNRDERQRRQIDTKDLEASIRRRGLLNPIIISDDFTLQTGERRLTACKNLGYTDILTRFASDLSPTEAQIIELEENIKRTDLEWQDLAKAIGRIHRLFVDLDPDWTITKTGEECCITQGTASLYLLVEARMGEERVATATTVREAYNIISRRDQRAAGAALQELLDAPDLTDTGEAEAAPNGAGGLAALADLAQPHGTRIVVPPVTPVVLAQPEAILHANFLDWAPNYRGAKFNFVHCDFPYGIDLFSGPQGRGAEPTGGYQDTEGTYANLLACFCHNLDRFMSISAHLMFWLSADFQTVQKTLDYFSRNAPSLHFHKFPLIWQKSDNTGIASDPRHWPRHTYEMCLLASRGGRQIVQIKADAHVSQIDRTLHPSCKPEPMLRHFMTMLVDETTTFLDPTCGSASSLRAAESLGAARVLGLEADEQYLDPARTALKQFRMKRALSAKVLP